VAGSEPTGRAISLGEKGGKNKKENNKDERGPVKTTYEYDKGVESSYQRRGCYSSGGS